MWNGFDFFCLRHGIKIQSACILSVQKNTYICRVKRHRRHGYEKLNELNRRSTRGSLYSNVHVRERERGFISRLSSASAKHTWHVVKKKTTVQYTTRFSFQCSKQKPYPGTCTQWRRYFELIEILVGAYRQEQQQQYDPLVQLPPLRTHFVNHSSLSSSRESRPLLDKKLEMIRGCRMRN